MLLPQIIDIVLIDTLNTFNKYTNKVRSIRPVFENVCIFFSRSNEVFIFAVDVLIPLRPGCILPDQARLTEVYQEIPNTSQCNIALAVRVLQ